ncbi:hypothetical protein SGPA1_12787 [Streptomyces misionensis JCM 4497]
MGAGVGLDLGHLGVPLQGGVVVDAALGVQHPAVPVVGELVQAQIGHDEEVVADLGAHIAQGDLEDAVGVGPGGALAVLLALLRHAEEHDPGDSGRHRVQRRLLQAVAGVLHDAGHGRDRHRLADALADERGQDQVGGVQARLGDHPPHDGRGPQPPGTRTGEGSVLRHASYATPAHPPPLPTHCRPHGAPLRGKPERRYRVFAPPWPSLDPHASPAFYARGVMHPTSTSASQKEPRNAAEGPHPRRRRPRRRYRRRRRRRTRERGELLGVRLLPGRHRPARDLRLHQLGHQQARHDDVRVGGHDGRQRPRRAGEEGGRCPGRPGPGAQDGQQRGVHGAEERGRRCGLVVHRVRLHPPEDDHGGRHQVPCADGQSDLAVLLDQPGLRGVHRRHP